MKISLPIIIACILFCVTTIKAQGVANNVDTTTASKKNTFISIGDYFSKGNFYAHSRSYFMSTINNGRLKDDYALAAGAGIGYKSPEFYGFGFALSGFFIFDLVSSELDKNDPYTNQPNRYELGLLDVTQPQNKKDLDRLEEAYLYYENKWVEAEVGRMNLNTPFINPQDGRMRPSLEEGAWAKIKPHKKVVIEGGWLWAFSPRSTVLWYPKLNSVGTYPVGVNTVGKKSGYANNVDSKGVGVMAIKLFPKNMEIELWNYVAHNVFNTAFLQYQYTIPFAEKRKIKIGTQFTRQDRINNGGNNDFQKAYYEGKSAMVVGARVEYADKKQTINVNFSHFTKEGRFLFPREWGRDPFYTFIPRERNEGFGNVNAFTVNYNYKFKTKGLSALLSAGIYQMPQVTNFALNKYGLGDYAHINTGIKYFFQNALKGLDVQLLLMVKLNMDDKNLPEKNLYNRVNLFHTNVIVNYYFNSKEFKK
jgi:hypothetical protein